MRICIVTREYPPLTAYSGGIGTHYAFLALELSRQGHETHVVTVTLARGHSITRDGVSVHLVKRPNPERLWFLEELTWTLAVDRALRRLGAFDVIFAPEWGGEAWWHARRGSAAPLITGLTTSVDQILAIAPEWRRSRRMRMRHVVQRRLEQGQTERSDAIVASSRAILAWTREMWDIERIPSTTLPNMVDVARLRRLAEGAPPTDFPADGPIVAFSGRLEIRKGVHILVEAMREIWDRMPEARLVMLGRDGDWDGGKMSERLRELAGPHASRLTILGNQPPERLFPALAAADIVAFPSLWENFALAALEAKALGCAMIATSGSGYDDFITSEEDGLLVPPGESPPLSAALERLLNDGSARRRLASRAAENAEPYDVSVVTRRHVDFFRQVAGGT